jgi:hypothetical protein
VQGQTGHLADHASIDPDTGDQTPAQTVSGKDPSEVV